MKMHLDDGQARRLSNASIAITIALLVFGCSKDNSVGPHRYRSPRAREKSGRNQAHGEHHDPDLDRAGRQRKHGHGGEIRYPLLEATAHGRRVVFRVDW